MPIRLKHTPSRYRGSCGLDAKAGTGGLRSKAEGRVRGGERTETRRQVAPALRRRNYSSLTAGRHSLISISAISLFHALQFFSRRRQPPVINEKSVFPCLASYPCHRRDHAWYRWRGHTFRLVSAGECGKTRRVRTGASRTRIRWASRPTSMRFHGRICPTRGGCERRPSTGRLTVLITSVILRMRPI